jgi:hypothetical protein
MSSKICWFALVVLGISVSGASAAGHGDAHWGVNRRGDHGINPRFGSPYYGYGGYGLGYGYGYPGLGYLYGFDTASVPYFYVFPPVPYGERQVPFYEPSPTMASEATQPPLASPPRPLRVSNPYYYAELNNSNPQVGGAKSEKAQAEPPHLNPPSPPKPKD